jgi:hypothetical protein
MASINSDGAMEFIPDEIMPELFLRNPVFAAMESEHAYCPAPPPSNGLRMRLQDRYSHNARAVFYSGSCPICLKDPIEPPMVAFACGHLVCVNDFKKLGGRVGADAMKTAVRVLEGGARGDPAGTPK